MEVAREFPHVHFRGFDKGVCLTLKHQATGLKFVSVPIMTRYPHDNVHFEIGDVREHLRIADASIDVVHARMTGLSVRVLSVAVYDCILTT